MRQDGIGNLLSVNHSVTSLGGGSREFRLPKGSAFMPLNRKILPQSGSTASALLNGHDGTLPEMAGDVIDPSVNHAVGNVKRDTTANRSWLRVGVGFLLGRTVGGERTARL